MKRLLGPLVALLLVVAPVASAPASASTANCDAAAMGQIIRDGNQRFALDGMGWRSLAYSVGWTPETWAHMTTLCGRESGGQATALNPSGATGLTQLLGWNKRLGLTRAQLMDPRINLAAALTVLCLQGWSAWTAPHYRQPNVTVCLTVHWTAAPPPRDTAPRITGTVPRIAWGTSAQFG